MVVPAEGCWALRVGTFIDTVGPELNANGGVFSTSNECPLGVDPDVLINK